MKCLHVLNQSGVYMDLIHRSFGWKFWCEKKGKPTTSKAHKTTNDDVQRLECFIGEGSTQPAKAKQIWNLKFDGSLEEKKGTSLEKEPTSNYGQEFEVVESSSSWEQDEKEVVSATFKDDEETNSLVKRKEARSGVHDNPSEY